MSLLSDIDMQSELDRLQRFRDAQCESEYEYPEPVEDHGPMSWSPILVAAAVMLPVWGAVGAIAVWALR